MRVLHVVTVGTSVVRNAASSADKCSLLERWRGKLDCWSKAGVDSDCDIEAGNNAIPSSQVFKDVLACVCDDPYSFSAELNSTLKFIEKYPGVHELILYATDTGTARFSARIIEHAVKECSKQWKPFEKAESTLSVREAKIVAGFGRSFWTGLLNLVKEVAGDVKKYRSEYDLVVANLTAGFKPESGFLLLVSALIGVDRAYYIHETMKDIVEIPLIPLKLDENIKPILEKVCRDEELEPFELTVLKRLGLVSEKLITPEAEKLVKILVCG